ncbi:Mitochondrial import inner membrane translocase subunit TIM10 [Heracleum sosnowskyi]|uniref:Mitochondrial import inner membrane translocase subunit n=1 Tax=Heracleum sosnowskyi TaxID=360622 RepID=A0AAD8H026_9APIA|nr:Mitochondrial import inner membrane translocase subunit TIM10 [Heracleum sosnowskyi]
MVSEHLKLMSRREMMNKMKCKLILNPCTNLLVPRISYYLYLSISHQKLEIIMAANNSPPIVDKEQIFGMAAQEMEYRVEMFNKLTHTCFNKCVEKRYKESELNMGENTCIDRCVSKYWHVTNLIGQLLGTGKPPM